MKKEFRKAVMHQSEHGDISEKKIRKLVFAFFIKMADPTGLAKNSELFINYLKPFRGKADQTVKELFNQHGETLAICCKSLIHGLLSDPNNNDKILNDGQTLLKVLMNLKPYWSRKTLISIGKMLDAEEKAAENHIRWDGSWHQDWLGKRRTDIDELMRIAETNDLMVKHRCTNAEPRKHTPSL